MGLHCDFNAFSRSYGCFYWWRIKIAEVLGFSLELMEYFYNGDLGKQGTFNRILECDELGAVWKDSLKRTMKSLPIKWEVLKPDPLHELLCHSDCDGYLTYGACGKIAKRLKQILPLIKDDPYLDYKQITKNFIKGCEKAYKLKKRMRFG